MFDTAERDQLILTLYRSVLEPTLASDAIEAINRWLDCDGIHIIGWSDLTERFTVNLATANLPKGEYSPYYRQIDPRWAHVSYLQEGKLFACHDVYDDRFVARDEFYKDLLIPRGLRYILAGPLLRDQHEEVVIAINHQQGRKTFDHGKAQQAAGLMPHLHTWLRQLRQTDMLRQAAWSGEQGLAGLEQGVVLLNSQRKILYLNPVAEGLLSLPARALSDRLKQHPLEDAIRRCQLRRHPEQLSLLLSCGEVLVHVLPVPTSGFQHPAELAGLTHPPGPSRETRRHGLELHPQGDILLLIRPRQRQQPASAANLAELFDLTPAESRLAHALARGDSAEQYASRHTLSLATVRSQIRAILQKTGEDNLQSLLRLLVLLPAV